jgi:predicted solute-binding protein
MVLVRWRGMPIDVTVLIVIPGELPIGTVPYLNAIPLTFGLEGLIALTPSRLALEFHAGRMAAALLSITEAMHQPGSEILLGAAIASDGPVYSVFLAHQDPLDRIEAIHVDPASCTSVNLLRVLLGLRGYSPRFLPLSDYGEAGAARNVLLIGNAAIAFRRGNSSHQFWDLGEAWKESTGLPFVYAAWQLLRGGHSERLRQRLIRAKEIGVANLAQLAEMRDEYDREFRRAYLGRYIRYDLGERERAGIKRFVDLLNRYGDRVYYPPEYVIV